MMSRVAAVLFSTVLAVVLPLHAEVETVNGPVAPGRWHSDFDLNFAYARESHLPLVFVWSRPPESCGNCSLAHRAVNLQSFSDWMAKRGYLFVFEQGSSAGAPSRVYAEGAGAGALPDFPCVRVYWAKSDGRVVDQCFSGVGGQIPGTTGETLKGEALSFALRSAIDTILTGAWDPRDPVVDPSCPRWPEDTGLTGSNGPIEPGEWNSNFAQGKAYAEEHGIPMLLFWANPPCDHCKTLEREVQEPDFVAWQKKMQMVMVFSYGTCSKDQQDAYAFAGLTSYPIIRVYWPKGGGAGSVNRAFTANDRLSSKYGKTVHEKVMNLVEEILVGYVPVPAYTGGAFLVGNTIGDRLEAQVGLTEYVDVPLVREDAVVSKPGANRLEWTFGGETRNADVLWAAGEKTKSVRVTLDGAFAAGQSIPLTLFSDEGDARATNLIACVNRGNSPKNPAWIGARSPDGLAWGEWTMDLEVAQQKAADYRAKNPDEKAYVLASVGGSMWCPDCARTESYLTETAAFKNWTAANRVACVAIDIPTDPTVGGPCLLTRDVKEVSAKYMDADPDGGPYQSGAGYLSRWMISDAAAQVVYDRNRRLVGVNTLNGGWNRPERANQKRTGVPIFVLLKSDGSIAGRIEALATESPSDASLTGGLIRRLDELLATAEKATGEADVHPLTTTATLAAKGGVATARLTGADAAICYRLSGVEAYADFSVRATGSTTAGLQNRVTIYSKVGETVSELVRATGSLASGLSARAELADPAAEYFVRVEIDGLASLANFGRDEPIASDVELVASLGYNCGSVSFSSSSQTVFVPDGSAEIEVVRQGGAFGPAAVRVVVADASSASGVAYSIDGADLSWSSGETGAKKATLTVSRTDSLASGSLTLGLVALEGNGAEVSTVRETIMLSDTDKPCFEQLDMTFDKWSMFAVDTSLALRNVDPNGRVQLKKVSGKLPSGIKLAYDKKSGQVLLSGSCRTPGVYEVTYVVAQGRETGLPATIRIEIADPREKNGFVNRKRDKQQIALLANGGEASLVVGQLTVSVAANNKITAKYEGTESRSLSFSGSWSDLTADGVAVAELQKSGAVLALRMDSSGKLSAVLTGAPSAFQAGEIAGSADWPTKDYGDWAGTYTVTFVSEGEGPVIEPSGTGFALLNVKRTGAVSWKGYLANGTAVNGSSQLLGAWTDGEGDKVAALPLYKRSGKDFFAALLEIKANGLRWTDDEYAQMVHAKKGTAAVHLHRENAWEYLLQMQAYGAWYPSKVTPVELCETFGYEKMSMTLRFDLSRLAASETQGAPLAIGDSTLAAEKRTIKAVAAAEGVTFSFAQRTGQISGGAKLLFESGKSVSGRYFGVLLPGWSGCASCSSRELIERPFASGTFFFKDTVNGRSVMRSVPVDIEVKPAVTDE